MNNILISAIVALLVSLGTEWFAKPALEARKERILEHHRTRRRIIAIALDDALRIEDHYVNQQDTSKPELLDEYRSLRAAMKPLRGKRNREALNHLDEAIKGSYTHHPMVLSGIAYLAAQYLNEPPWHLRTRKKLFANLLEGVSKNQRSH